MTTTKQIVILVGPPGSGKTTYAEQIMNEAWGQGIKTSRISQDDQGKQGHMDLFDSALDNQIPLIIIDRMGFSKEQRARYILPAREAGYKVKIVVFHVGKKTCYDRMMARENHPTINGLKAVKREASSQEIQNQNVLDNETRALIEAEKSQVAYSALGTFFKNYQRVTDDEADIVERKGWENAKGRALVVDIDGTIADIEHRRKHVDRTLGKPNWMKFFDEMHLDTPNQWCVDLVKAFYEASNRMTPEQQPYTIIFASGRPDNHRKMSEEWLDKALGHRIYQNLFMRRRDDSRQDNIVKEIILEFELKPLFKQLLVVDDRKQVVDMWRSHGYTVLQCDVGNF
jgi:predicted kinase